MLFRRAVEILDRGGIAARFARALAITLPGFRGHVRQFPAIAMTVARSRDRGLPVLRKGFSVHPKPKFDLQLVIILALRAFQVPVAYLHVITSYKLTNAGGSKPPVTIA
jgi:hypothetical protein